jgi:hypothetical protein
VRDTEAVIGRFLLLSAARFYTSVATGKANRHFRSRGTLEEELADLQAAMKSDSPGRH